MRFLIDNSLSPFIADGLKKSGHDAAHVRGYGMQKAADPLIFDRAKSERRTIVAAIPILALFSLCGKPSGLP